MTVVPLVLSEGHQCPVLVTHMVPVACFKGPGIPPMFSMALLLKGIKVGDIIHVVVRTVHPVFLCNLLSYEYQFHT
jgi:hypothetical protein